MLYDPSRADRPSVCLSVCQHFLATAGETITYQAMISILLQRKNGACKPVCCDADCEETAEPVEIANSSTTSVTSATTAAAAAVAAAATAAAAAGEDEDDDDVSDPAQQLILDISPEPNEHGELVRAVGSSVVFTCRRLTVRSDDDAVGDGDGGGGGDLAAEATTVEWFDKNDVRIRSQTANRRLSLVIITCPPRTGCVVMR